MPLCWTQEGTNVSLIWKVAGLLTSIVIGGGAAGLMCAAEARKRGRRVAVLGT